MTWLPEFTTEELARLDPDLIAFLLDKSLWKEWDKVILPANTMLWDYFREAIGEEVFLEGARDTSEEYKKFEGAWRPPEGYESWTGGTQYADRYFKSRGAEFIKQISDTDRKRVKDLMVKNWGVGEREFAKRIKDEYLFSPARSKTIYRTETHTTHEAGGFFFAVDGGAETKSWLGNQQNACEICIRLNGEFRPLKEPFSIGVMFAHAHVSCRCTTLYYMDSMETEGGARRLKRSQEALREWQAGAMATA